MAAAHPDIVAAARYLAPGNDEDGVVRVLEHLLDIDADAVPADQIEGGTRAGGAR